MSSPTFLEQAKNYVLHEVEAKFRTPIQKLIDSNNLEKITEIFDQPRINFGTAGLRAPMAPGFSTMNPLIIIQTTQGLAKYLLAKADPEKMKKGIIIGYDGRHNSRNFAEHAARVFQSLNVPVYFYPRIVPTPILAFGSKHLGLACGIMVTASHNPKDDNGYKVYWGNWCQLNSPHDALISEEILKNLTPWTSLKPFDESKTINPFNEPYNIWSHYSKGVSRYCDNTVPVANQAKFVYTAMHGVGTESVLKIFKDSGMKAPICVKEQCDPDPDFPTVKFPNPEEGKGALALSIKTANENGCNFILANDPDADRFALAEKQPDGDFYVFSGNEVGLLFTWWLLQHLEKFPKPADKKHVVITSTVSSKILKSVAKKHDLIFQDCLTGFKWIANIIKGLSEQGHVGLLGYEQSIGFMIGETVYDKDGVSAAVIMAQAINDLVVNQKKTVMQKLNELFKEYGYYISQDHYYFLSDDAAIKALFNRIRTSGPNGGYVEFEGYTCTGIRDLGTGYDSTQPDNKAILAPDPTMITFYFEKAVATVRMSGTEPKCKYYSEWFGDYSLGPEKNLENAKHFLDAFLRAIFPDKFSKTTQTKTST